LRQGTAIYDPNRHGHLAYIYGQDSGVACLSHEAWDLWFLGYPDQARKRIGEALTLAHAVAHPVSTAAAANIASWVYQLLRDRQAMREQAEAAVALSTEREFEFWRAMGVIGQGWAMVEQGQLDVGIGRLRTALNSLRSIGGGVLMPYFLSLLAQAYASAGKVEEGLSMLEESQHTLDASGEFWWQAELYRLKGELLLRQTWRRYAEEKEAEEYFKRAHAVAREQRAKSLELRAAMSLSLLWHTRGSKSQARRTLAEVYNWFSEGFGTPDLQEARMLLEQLSRN
jgi:adenylate cyclase